MSTTQCAHMVAHTVQVILERSNLRPRIIRIFLTRWLTSRNISGEVEAVHREDDWCFRFVPKNAVLSGEPLELDEEDGWKPGDGKGLRCSSRDFTSRAVPVVHSASSAYVMVAHQASSLSITSDLTNSSISSWTTTAFFPAGTGRDSVPNVSYVVDV